jgi:hypothetical protein
MRRRYGINARGRWIHHSSDALIPSESYARHIDMRFPIMPGMINAESNPTRTLTLVLPEEDWKALRAAEPDAIGWLRAQIQNRLAVPSAPWSSRSNPTSSTTAESWWGNEDEY